MPKPLLFVCVLLGVFFSLGPTGVAQVPGFDWVTPGQQPATFEAQGQATQAATDAAGNTFVTGSFQGTLTLGATTLTSTGDYDAFVAKLLPDGSYAWAVQAGGRGADFGTGIALDASGNVHVAGRFESYTATFGQQQLQNISYGPSLFLARLSPDGKFQRVLSAGGPDDNYIYPQALALDAAGNAYVTGGLRGYGVAFGLHSVNSWGGYNAFVAKLDAAGVWQWARVVGDYRAYDFGSAISTDAAGNVYVAGTFNGEGPHFDQLALPGSAGTQLFVARLDGQYGRWQWAVRGGAGVSRCQAIAVDATGNCYLTGSISGQQATLGPINLPAANNSTDILVAKLSGQAVWQWARRVSGTGNDNGLALALTDNGNITITGNFASSQLQFGSLPALSSHGKTDLFVAQLDPEGTWRWALGGGGSGEESGWGLTAAPGGDVRLLGSYAGPGYTLGTTELPAGGKYYEYFSSRFFVANIHDFARNSAGTFTLWPNPSQGTVWAAGLPDNAPVQVFDAVGRLVVPNARPVYEATGLRLPALPAGVYFVRCGKETRRLELL
ncbi:SBBP repeat-containing protein [Hymenobacter rigui]|uniref:T9SS C-terminal target domain-containing protein n=1 Tax=Hymenobacter rigui TaxID=334424 RepID=A0A3R9P7A0_9BACT|nr:SBBP repeat-containing protein [Hymenobacter rigui]RSK50362.1 T9SS C-terminal target domain-containing protein [Hymenobacter rigui]